MWVLFLGTFVDPKAQLKSGASLNVTYVFLRNMLNKPVAILPVASNPTIAIRCNPRKWKKLKSGYLKLPYRLIWAVATTDSILIYDSEQSLPIAFVEGIHLAELTDLSWFDLQTNFFIWNSF